MVVRLAGRLSAQQVGALFEACASSTEPPLLELDDLISADAMGVDALFRLEAKGAQLVGMPEYLRLKLNDLSRQRG